MLTQYVTSAVWAMAAMTGIVALRYLMVSGGFSWWSLRRQPALHKGLRRQIRREIGWSLLSAGIYGIPAGLAAFAWQAHGWTRIYLDVSERPLWWLPVSFLLCLAIHDTWFYWTHRLMHWPRFYRLLHRLHHRSNNPSPWTSYSFDIGEAVFGVRFVFAG